MNADMDKIKSLEKELAACRDSLEKSVAMNIKYSNEIADLRYDIAGLKSELAIVEPMPVMPPELFHEVSLMKKQLKAYKEALEEIVEHCKRDILVNLKRIEHHAFYDEATDWEIANAMSARLMSRLKVLTPVQSPDARENATK